MLPTVVVVDVTCYDDVDVNATNALVSVVVVVVVAAAATAGATAPVITAK